MLNLARIHAKLRRPKTSAAVVVVLTVGVGVVLRFALANVIPAIEAEEGRLASGATITANSQASGGKMITFGLAATPTPTPTPTPSPSPTATALITPSPTQTTNWIIRLPGTTYQAAGITWRTHAQGAASSTLQVQQDASVANHFLMTVGESGAPSDTSLYMQRAELEPATGYSFNKNTVYWMGYSFKITGRPPDGVIVPTNGAWCVLMQAHQNPDAGDNSGPQPFGLYWMGDGSLIATRRYDPNPITTATSFTPVETVVAPALTTGVWHHVEARLVFDNGVSGTGAMTIWYDGAKKVEQLNVPFGYNDANNNFPKMGIYRAASTGVMTAEFRNISIGSTDLSDRTGLTTAP